MRQLQEERLTDEQMSRKMQDSTLKLESDLKQARSQATLFDSNNHQLRQEIEALRD